MSSRRPLWDQLADLMVDSLRVVEASARAADSRLEKTFLSQAEPPSLRPHVRSRPAAQSVDSALSDWANRTVRRLTLPHLGQPGPRGLATDLLASLADSAAEGWSQWRDLPVKLPIAFTRLSSELLLRGEAVAASVAPQAIPDFLSFTAKTWSDLPIYFSLQYNQALEILRARLAESPNDADLLFAYAMTLLECGLSQESARLFESLADSGERRAHHWAMIALIRCGQACRAVDHGVAECEREDSAATARLWLHLAAAESGRAGDIPAESRLTIFSRDAETSLELEEVSALMGIHKTAGGRGTAVFDVTGDGTLDVLIAGAHSGISLYLNNGDGTFRDRSVGSGLDACVYAFGLAPGDFDNDGRTDLFVTGLGFFDGQGMLLRNRGDGTFEDATAGSGLDIWGPGFTASWIDYDGDGWLDLFVVNNLGGLFDRKTPNRLFHNNRDGTFSDVTAAAGLATPWPSLGHCWGDFTNDGLPDLFLSNFGRAQLFKNRGNGTFDDISREAGVDSAAIGSVALALDIDGDGWLDILQLTYSRPADALFTLENGYGPEGGSPPRLFKNQHNGTFEECAEGYGLNGCWGTMSANIGDLGNRGALDLVLGNGDPAMDRTEPTVLYQQRDDGVFRDVTAAVGLPLRGKGHGINLADLHGDGRLHVIAGHGGLYPGDLMPTTLHRPKSAVGHWLNVRLIGKARHAEALGARLSLATPGKTQHRIVSPGTSFGALPLEQHFGLGESTVAQQLTIRWPGGLVQTLQEIPADQTVEIEEGCTWRRLRCQSAPVL